MTYKDTIRMATDILSFNNPNYRIVIVDNNSPNESFQYISSSFNNNPAVDVISSVENGGYAKGNNIGLRFAERYNPEYACVINNDVFFDDATIETLIYYYDVLPSPAVISPLQTLPDGSVAQFGKLVIPTFMDDVMYTLPYVGRLWTTPHKYEENINVPNIQEVEFIPGAFLFIKFNVFKSIGYFDESTFLFCEERFLAYKIRKLGLKNYLLLNASYVHCHSTTINQVANKIRQTQMLYDSRVVYTKSCRKFAIPKIFVLYVAHNINKIVQICRYRTKLRFRS